MTQKYEHNNSPDQPSFFDQFSKEEQAELKKIWGAGKKASPDQPEITSHEVDKAFSQVNQRIDIADSSTSKSTREPTYYDRWKWPAAAAIALLIGVIVWLFIPQTVSVPYGKVAQVTLPDGSKVTLNSGSELQYNQLYSYTNRNLKLNGEAFFSVRHGENPFVVHAQNTAVKVTGTKFNVRSWAADPEASTEVTVLQGTVEFYEEDSTNIVKINPGEESSISDKMSKPSVPRKVDIGRILGWRSNKLIFTNRPLAVIFNELERRFDININVKNAEIGHQKLSAYYSDPSGAESILKDICRVKGLRYYKTAHGFSVGYK